MFPATGPAARNETSRRGYNKLDIDLGGLSDIKPNIEGIYSPLLACRRARRTLNAGAKDTRCACEDAFPSGQAVYHGVAMKGREVSLSGVRPAVGQGLPSPLRQHKPATSAQPGRACFSGSAEHLSLNTFHVSRYFWPLWKPPHLSHSTLSCFRA